MIMKKNVTSIFFALLVVFNFSDLFAQPKKNKAKMIDSSTSVVAIRPRDTLKVGAYNSLAWQIKNTGKYDLAVSYGTWGHVLAEKLNDSVGLAELVNGLGVTYFRKGLYDSSILEIKATKVAIGGYTPNDQIFQEHSIHVNAVDKIYLFSDGYADQFGGEKGKKLTTRKFKELLISNSSLNMEAQHKVLQSFIKEWSGPIEQVDDLLVIGIQI